MTPQPNREKLLKLIETMPIDVNTTHLPEGKSVITLLEPVKLVDHILDWHQAAIGEEVLKVLEEIEKKFGKITFGTKFWKWHREKVAKLQSQNPSTEEGENHG